MGLGELGVCSRETGFYSRVKGNHWRAFGTSMVTELKSPFRLSSGAELEGNRWGCKHIDSPSGLCIL